MKAALTQLAGRPAAGGVKKLKGKVKGGAMRAMGKAGKMAQKGLGAVGMGSNCWPPKRLENLPAPPRLAQERLKRQERLKPAQQEPAP